MSSRKITATSAVSELKRMKEFISVTICGATKNANPAAADG